MQLPILIQSIADFRKWRGYNRILFSIQVLTKSDDDGPMLTGYLFLMGCCCCSRWSLSNFDRHRWWWCLCPMVTCRFKGLPKLMSGNNSRHGWYISRKLPGCGRCLCRSGGYQLSDAGCLHMIHSDNWLCIREGAFPTGYKLLHNSW